MGISPRGLLEGYSLVKVSATGRNTQRGLDRNFCRKWATNLEKAWARMLKVGTNDIYKIACLFILEMSFNRLHFKSRLMELKHFTMIQSYRYYKPN